MSILDYLIFTIAFNLLIKKSHTLQFFIRRKLAKLFKADFIYFSQHLKAVNNRRNHT